jgi:hypothetical protein
LIFQELVGFNQRIPLQILTVKPGKPYADAKGSHRFLENDEECLSIFYRKRGCPGKNCLILGMDRLVSGHFGPPVKGVQFAIPNGDVAPVFCSLRCFYS